jgi:molybdenum cofactor biosynthesis enzyme MoaA
MVEEEVKKLLPELLAEAVAEIKNVSKLNETTTAKKPAIDRNRLAELMGINYDRPSGTITATTNGIPRTVSTVDSAGNRIEISADKVDPTVMQAITKDYSEIMKKLKL